jgi:hypothetical protein
VKIKSQGVLPLFVEERVIPWLLPVFYAVLAGVFTGAGFKNTAEVKRIRGIRRIHRFS